MKLYAGKDKRFMQEKAGLVNYVNRPEWPKFLVGVGKDFCGNRWT